MAPCGDVFDLRSNRIRRADRRLDARWKTFGLLAVAADRYTKELEKLPMERSEFGDIALQWFTCSLQFVSLDRLEYVQHPAFIGGLARLARMGQDHGPAAHRHGGLLAVTASDPDRIAGIDVIQDLQGMIEIVFMALPFFFVNSF